MVFSKSSSVSPGEADDKVRRQAQIRARLLELARERLEFERRIAALHRREYAVGAGLHRQVQVGNELGQLAVTIDDARGHLARVARRIADALNAGDLVHIFEQQREVGDFAVFHDAAVGVDVLAEQRDFLDALLREPCDFGQHVVERSADFLPACEWHDAVGAEFRAPFHDRDESGRVLGASRRQVVELLNLGERDVDLRLAARPAFGDQLGQAVQRLRTKHDVDIRRTLDDDCAFLAGDATTDADHDVRIGLLQVLHAAEVREHLFLRLFTHRTGVEQDHVGFLDAVGLDVAFGLG